MIRTDCCWWAHPFSCRWCVLEDPDRGSGACVSASQRRPDATFSGGDHTLCPVGPCGLEQWAASDELRAEADFWLNESRRDVGRLPTGRSTGPGRAGSAATVGGGPRRSANRGPIAPGSTGLSHPGQRPSAGSVGPNSRFLEQGPRVWCWTLEGHGREDLFDADLSRTAGWFTTIFPVRLDLTGAIDPAAHTKDRQGAAAADSQPRSGIWLTSLPAQRRHCVPVCRRYHKPRSDSTISASSTR